MKAVVLAAGESTRMRPLTFARPKCMIPVAGRPALAHNLENLREAGIEEVILVVGFKRGQIEGFFGNEFEGMKLKYVVQNERKGTGHAYLMVEELVRGEKFVGMCGDDYYGAESIKNVMKGGNAIGAKAVEDPEKFGVLTVEKGKLKKITEKPEKPESSLVNTGLYLFTPAVFDELRKVEKSERGELEATDAVSSLAGKEGVKVVEVEEWQPLGYSWHVLDLNALLLEKLETEIEGELSENSHVEGALHLGKGSVVLPGTTIEGPVWIGKNCRIGPNAYIRGSTTIGDGCRVGNCVEMKNSLLMEKVYVSHLSYIGDSIIGGDCNFGAGCITANLRHDEKSVRTLIKGRLVYTNKRKFGAVVGDHCKFGVNTSIAEGRVIGPHSWVDSHNFVHDNIPPGFLQAHGSLQEVEELRIAFEKLKKNS